MPVIPSQYRPPFYLPGGTLQTLIPARMPRLPIPFSRETLELSDGDFLDLDWYKHGNKKLIIATHGLEGSSHSQYILDMCHQIDKHSFDLLAWNCRSCSGRMNRLPKLYHHGEIEDLSAVITHAIEAKGYTEIYLAGFSMGGNISIKYLALNKTHVNVIKRCAIVSTPCDLAAASRALDKLSNFILNTYFRKKLFKKMRAKESQFPGSFPMSKFHQMGDWHEFDQTFSAPFNGYNSADAFYKDASANTFLDRVDTRTFIINAINDPVLSASCHPIDVAKNSAHIYLELPKSGGHVYFPMRRKNYAVNRLLSFFNE